MKTSTNGLSIIKKFEGLRLNAYQDQVGIWTIGWGNTFYPDGAKVRMGEKISIDKADYMLRYTVSMFAVKVSAMLKVALNQNQFDALVSFAYNVGTAALAKSTLLKKVNTDPNDPSIAREFARWNKAGGKMLPGLTQRRKLEADLYFKPV